MSNLTTAQLAALASGQPVRQTWSIVGVSFRTLFGPPSVIYQTTVIDNGVFAGPGSLTRILKAGSRTHTVLNPHPMESAKPNAVRYSIEVANGDGFFHRKVGSVWSPGTYNAHPRECLLMHSLAVWIPDLYSPYWSPIPHMDYVGQVIDVSYEGAATQAVATSTISASVLAKSATIISEQVGAELALRRVFTPSDADVDMVTDTTSGDVTYTF